MAHIALVLTMTSVLVSSMTVSQDVSVPFEATECGVAFEPPQEPKYSRRAIGGGAIAAHDYRIRTDSLEFVLMCARDYSFDPGNAEGIFDGLRQVTLQHDPGSLIAEEVVIVGGLEGREIRWRDGSRESRMRMFILDGLLITMSVNGKAEQMTSVSADRYLNSISVTDE